MTENILALLRLLFWTILLCCHSSGLHLQPCHRAAQWCELDLHWYCTSAWWPIRLRATLCQRLFWNQWRHGTDSAGVGGTFHTGFWGWRSVLWCFLRLWTQPVLQPIISSAWGLSLFKIIFSMTLLEWLMRLIVLYFWQSCKFPFLGSVITSDWVHGVGHSPVLQILLQISLKTSIMVSPPAWTSSAGILSTPADLPFSMMLLQSQLPQ